MAFMDSGREKAMLDMGLPCPENYLRYLRMESKLEPVLSMICHLCSKFRDQNSLDCMVCCQCFHKHCLLQNAMVVQSHLEAPFLHLRWSCPKCASLRRLLKEEELSQIFTVRFDSKCDYLSWNAFLQYQKSKFIGDMPHSQENLEKILFDYFDPNGEGRIHWKTFVNLESLRLLESSCSTKEMVCLLSTAEVYRMKQAWEEVDVHKMGSLTAGQVQRAVNKWGKQRGYNLRTDIFNSIRSYPWDQFILMTANVILASRPNTFDSPDFLAVLGFDAKYSYDISIIKRAKIAPLYSANKVKPLQQVCANFQPDLTPQEEIQKKKKEKSYQRN